MMFGVGLGDGHGRIDDESVIYRTDDRKQKVHWGRLAFSYVVGSLLAVAVIAGAGALVGEGAAITASAVKSRRTRQKQRTR